MKKNTFKEIKRLDVLEKPTLFAKQQEEIKNTFKEIETLRKTFFHINETLYIMNYIVEQEMRLKKNPEKRIETIEKYLYGLMGTNEYLGKNNIQNDLLLGSYYKKIKSILKTHKLKINERN